MTEIDDEFQEMWDREDAEAFERICDLEEQGEVIAILEPSDLAAMVDGEITDEHLSALATVLGEAGALVGFEGKAAEFLYSMDDDVWLDFVSKAAELAKPYEWQKQMIAAFLLVLVPPANEQALDAMELAMRLAPNLTDEMIDQAKLEAVAQAHQRERATP